MLQAQGAHNRSRPAFFKLCNNIALPTVDGDPTQKVPIFVAPVEVGVQSMVWQYSMMRQEVKELWQAGELRMEPTTTFTVESTQLLTQQENSKPGVAVQQVVVGITKVKGGKTGWRMVGPADSDQGDALRFCWTDGVPFFSTTTGHMRKLKLQLFEPQVEHKNLMKWQNELAGVSPAPKIWKHVWLPYRQDKVNHFLWQVAL
jgi:hypothetical protein